VFSVSSVVQEISLAKIAKCAKFHKANNNQPINQQPNNPATHQPINHQPLSAPSLAKIPSHAEESLIPQQLNNPTTGNSPLRVLRGSRNLSRKDRQDPKALRRFSHPRTTQQPNNPTTNNPTTTNHQPNNPPSALDKAPQLCNLNIECSIVCIGDRHDQTHPGHSPP